MRIWAVRRDMTEKCEATRRAAGRPATGPSAAAATGTLAMASAITRNRCTVPTAVPTVFEAPPPTLPPPPSCRRISGMR